MNILRAIDDPAVFGQHFHNSDTWTAWRAFLAALFALPMNESERRIYRRCTGRKNPPKNALNECWLVIGRRGGKSFVLALIAVFLACFRDWRPYLGPGERCTIMIIAADRKQARVIMRYVVGLLQSVPMLSGIIESEAQESVSLTNRVTVEVHTASFRTVRGYAICAALCDEAAFWPTDESANPDTEIIAALRPAMATIPGSILLCASSPYSRRGALWEAHRTHYGKDGDPILVWQSPTRVMNPTVPQEIIDQALVDDPAHAQAEWMAQFRSDIEAFVSREAVEAVINRGVLERPPVQGVRYYGFVDPSGGSADAFTMAIGHKDKTKDAAVLDCVREVKPPFSPESVVAEFALLLRSYGISRVRGDRYAGEWPREQFRKRNIEYFPSEKPRSDLYLDLLPAINSGRVDLLDIDRLTAQLCALERRTARSGRDSIDHPPGGHDDLANSVAGVVNLILGQSKFVPTLAIGGIEVFSGDRREPNWIGGEVR
jgi:hypothetical protein